MLCCTHAAFTLGVLLLSNERNSFSHLKLLWTWISSVGKGTDFVDSVCSGTVVPMMIKKLFWVFIFIKVVIVHYEDNFTKFLFKDGAHHNKILWQFIATGAFWNQYVPVIHISVTLKDVCNSAFDLGARHGCSGSLGLAEMVDSGEQQQYWLIL